MQQDILINWSPQETRVAVVEHGAVQELHIERTLERGLVGNVYLGKVSRVLPGMQSAFIDIGLERAAFLHVADVWQRQPDGEPPAFARKTEPQVPIEKQVFEGQALMVQVIKDPIGTKGARLSTQISVAGRLLVFLPQDDHMSACRRRSPPARAARCPCAARLQALLGEADKSAKAAPARAASSCAPTPKTPPTTNWAGDIAYLRKTWARHPVRQRLQAPPAMPLLHQELEPGRSACCATWSATARRPSGSTRCPAVRQRLQVPLAQHLHAPTAAVASLQHLYKGERPIFDLYTIDDRESARALARRVELKSGGYLIVDQTEALTTVDVNTGGYVGARNFDDTIYKTNLEAAQAIARQLRLRNLGGIIIVDFIDMQREDHQRGTCCPSCAEAACSATGYQGHVVRRLLAAWAWWR